jgi:2-methylcitrate dehydratase
MGYPSALSAKGWGFQDVLFKGRPIALERPLGSYVMENVLFKISFPAEFHAQTAVEAALRLHPAVAGRVGEITRIALETQEAGVRIIDKTGPLANPADRDHCLQYMVAVPLLFGRLTAEDYEDEVARDPRIDALRATMVVTENPEFSRDYLDPDKRAIGNAVQVFFKDGSSTERVGIDYPLGHRRRRAEGIPQLVAKFERSLATLFGAEQRARIAAACAEQARFEALRVEEFMDLWVPPS